MPDNLILRINNLSCSYSGREEDKVFYIKKLDIRRGKIIFLLGASGSGKSTLLETIGLMNNTIANGTVEFILSQNESIEYSALWKNKNLDQINHVRKKFLSFIFQNTNLMENFTAYENICLSQMIKSDTDQKQAFTGARKLMAQVGLPESEVGFNALSVNLSGGQRQRVSFVRALNNDYKILLCDEPTGNLDEVNAHELLNIVKENLTQDKTALIVSHDINLALKYADEIILLKKNEAQNYGEILDEHIFKKEQWQSLDTAAMADFRKMMLGYFKAPSKQIENTGLQKQEQNFARDYRKLFIHKEGKILFGKSYLNLLILVFIISITLLAIGFANGALKYMNQKKNDPFVNWLTIGIPPMKSSADQVREFTETLNSESTKKRFLINNVTTYKVISLPLFHEQTAETEYTQGRLLSSEDPIRQALLEPGNLIAGDTTAKDDHDLGIIVTQKLLARLGYPADAKLIYLDNGDTSGLPPVNFKVPVPIRAIIKEIPGKNNFLVSNYFLAAYRATSECVFSFKEQQRKKIIFFVDGDKKMALKLKEEINRIRESFELADTSIRPAAEIYQDEESEESPADSTLLNDNIISQQLQIEINVDTCEQLWTPGYQVIVEFDAIPYTYATTEKIVSQISQLPWVRDNKSKILRIFDYNIGNNEDEDVNNDYLCINFSGGEGGLDSIEAFSSYLANELNSGKEKDQTNILQVDSGNIKEKKNFNYISKMTFLIAALLIVFAILAISFFISNLLKTHLNKVKMNIGTYKAFGLSDKESQQIYLQIMLRFILIGLFISFVVAYVSGNLIGKMFEKSLNIDDKPEYFRIFDLQTYILLGIIILVTVAVSYVNINRILSKTPGDLIYNR